MTADLQPCIRFCAAGAAAERMSGAAEPEAVDDADVAVLTSMGFTPEQAVQVSSVDSACPSLSDAGGLPRHAW